MWIQGVLEGQSLRRSVKTTSWERAEEIKRELEDGRRLARQEQPTTMPCARQPCLHRIFAECLPDAERILSLAGRYGLLTVSIPRTPAPGQIVRADVLPPEPVEIWRKEIEALRACTELSDSIANDQQSGTARERLGRKISEHLARVPFYITVAEQSPFAFRYCPLTLSAALWQRFAAEVAGLIHPVCCPAPNCGRWFLRGPAARGDKRFCSNACRNRAFRLTRISMTLESQ
jgi:hypothetical protein